MKIKKINEKLYIKLYNSGEDSFELAQTFGISERSAQKYEQLLRKQGKVKLRKYLKIYQRKNENLKKTEYYQKSLDMILAIRNELNKTSPFKIRVQIKKSKKGDTLIIQFTDWHVGREVKNELGEVIYNEKIFELRIKKLINEMLQLLDKYIKRGTPIKDVVIISTGDLVDGQGIFATQETMQELSPPFQVVKVADIIKNFISALLARKLAVYFYGVKGNHGEIRVNGKNRDPNANWDLMVYLILDMWVKDTLKNKKVYINYSELDYLNFNVQGWKYHIRHKAPKQSETASGKAKFLGWAKSHKFDALVYGHYHHWGVWDRSKITVFRGGSISGTDEFGEELAEDSEPIQLIWGCNEKRPLTFFYPVDLGKKEKGGVDD